MWTAVVVKVCCWIKCWNGDSCFPTCEENIGHDRGKRRVRPTLRSLKKQEARPKHFRQGV